MGTYTLNIAHSGHSIPAAACFHGCAMAPNVLLDIIGYCDTGSAEAKVFPSFLTSLPTYISRVRTRARGVSRIGGNWIFAAP